MGFEPMISGMKAPRPRPLDEQAILAYRNYNLIVDINTSYLACLLHQYRNVTP